MTWGILDQWRFNSDMRRYQGRGTIVDTVFLHVRGRWLKFWRGE